MINDCAGYTSKYYDENFEKVGLEELIKKYRIEKEKHQESQFKDSELLGDNYPHCLLVIEGVQKLYQMGSRYKQYDPYGGSDTLASDYLDTMILRLDTGSQGDWYRNHFPVILETNMSQYFNETIYNDMQ